MEAVIFIGVQGAGKTTFYRERFFETHVRISLDMLRTRRREQLLLEACLKGGQRFVVDNTNCRASDRTRYVGPARRAGFRVVAYFFRVALQEAIRRNDQRNLKQRIPVAAIVGTFNRLQNARSDEGFDDIHIVEPGAS